jgi:hypothetical protein
MAGKYTSGFRSAHLSYTFPSLIPYSRAHSYSCKLSSCRNRPVATHRNCFRLQLVLCPGFAKCFIAAEILRILPCPVHNGNMVEGEIPNELLITLETTGRPTNLTLTEHELHVVSIDSSERELCYHTATCTDQHSFVFYNSKLHALGALFSCVKVSLPVTLRSQSRRSKVVWTFC